MDKVKKLVVVPVELEKQVYKHKTLTPKNKTIRTITPKKAPKKKAPKKTAVQKKVSWTIVD